MVHHCGHAGTNGTTLFHGVGNSDDSSNKHLTHLIKAVGCRLKERSKQNVCVDEVKEDGVDNSVDGGVKHLTYLTKT
eukprot:3885874-Ditylum_brightwellii.AAC.1